MKKIFVLVLMAFIWPALHGQITVTIGSMLLQDPGTDIHVPVYVKGLDAITGGIPVTGIELHVKYSNSYLEYDTTLNFSTLTPSTQWFFGVTPLEYGANWVEPNLAKLSIPDDTRLFDIVFHYQGGTTELVFDSIRSILLDSSFAIIPNVHFVNGLITPSAGTGESRWNGNGPWNTMSNWSNGIPGDSTDAIIETGEVTILSNAVCKSVTMNPGTTTIVAAGFGISVNKNFTNNGTFRMDSDATGEGSVIVRGIVSGVGTNNLERYLGFENGFPHLVSAPVSTATAALFSGITTQSYNEQDGSWTTVSQSGSLITGMGYRVAGSNASTVTFQGDFNTGDVTVSGLEYTATSAAAIRGLNLVGNPFPSAVQWEQGSWYRNNLDYAVYVWDGYKFLSWNGVTGALSDGIIPAMQGFYVKSNAPGGSITIPEDARMHSVIPFYKEVAAAENLMKVKIESTSNGSFYDETFIHIRPGTTNGFDATSDAWKIFGSDAYSQVYSFGGDQSILSINSIPDPAPVSLGFRTGATGSYKFTFSGINSFNSTQPLFFEDKQTSTIINLRNSNEFVFSTDLLNDPGRFILHFTEVGLSDPAMANLIVRVAGGKISISRESGSAIIYDVALYNTAGSQVYRSEDAITPAVFQIDGALQGLFILRMNTSEGVFVRKLLLHGRP